MTHDNYEDIISTHYKKVADEQGDSPNSTMADSQIREMETDAICRFVAEIMRIKGSDSDLVVMDVGCGNGYTLQVLKNKFPKLTFIGLEKTPELFEIASNRFKDVDGVTIKPGDIRQAADVGENHVDVLLCQRVLINLLDVEDQKQALSNLISAMRHPSEGAGHALFIESFSTPLATLNEARSEFELEPIEPAYHNLYLEDDYFERPQLAQYTSEEFELPSNLLSTYYYTARVLHAMLTEGKAFKRNSEFVKFISSALAPAVGNYSPLLFHAFERVE